MTNRAYINIREFNILDLNEFKENNSFILENEDCYGFFFKSKLVRSRWQ